MPGCREHRSRTVWIGRPMRGRVGLMVVQRPGDQRWIRLVLDLEGVEPQPDRPEALFPTAGADLSMHAWTDLGDALTTLRQETQP
jgi:hypothetical protein